MISTKSTTFLVTAMAALLGACSSTPVATTNAPDPMKSAVVPAPVAPPRTAAAPNPTRSDSGVTTVSLPAYLDPKSSISSARSVFFEFDEYTVKPDDTTLIERHGKYLASNPGLAIRIEGNTDERGGVEYNLALGQKRAEAVRVALKVYGAKDAQLEATSWGENKPKAPGHDESSWTQNRRADLQYPAK